MGKENFLYKCKKYKTNALQIHKDLRHLRNKKSNISNKWNSTGLTNSIQYFSFRLPFFYLNEQMYTQECNMVTDANTHQFHDYISDVEASEDNEAMYAQSEDHISLKHAEAAEKKTNKQTTPKNQTPIL